MLTAKSRPNRVAMGLTVILGAILTIAEIALTAGPSFETVIRYPVPFYPTFVEIADMNGDGLNDLVVASQDHESFPQPRANVAVLLNRGARMFLLVDSLTVNRYAIRGFCVADFDGDHDNDIVVPDTGGFALIKNRGDGVLDSTVSFIDSTWLWSVMASDFDGDGAVDLAGIGYDSISVFLNDGTGRFTRHARYLTGAYEVAITVADVDGNGRDDIIFANSSAHTIRVLQNEGEATFVASDIDSLDSNINSLFVADLDRDGHLDLAATGDSPGVLRVLMNSGDGTFVMSATYAVTYSGPERQYSVSGGDVNEDGAIDLLVAGELSNRLQLFVNDGDGTFTASGIYDAPNPGLIVAGDLDANTNIDFALSWGTVINNGDGTLAASRRWDVEVGYGGLTSGDFDGDGYTDLAVAGQNYGLISLLRNVGDGTFHAPLETRLPIDPDGGITSADFDGDHDLDIIVWKYFGDAPPHFLKNYGDGTFATAIPVEGATNVTRSMCAADFDGDGDIDLATGSGIDTLSILKNNGHGTFVADGRYGVLGQLSCILAADYDNDGDLDIATASGTPLSMSVLMNNGDGTFEQREDVPFGTLGSPASLAAADFDGDGLVDIAVVNSSWIQSATVSVLRNCGGGSFILLHSYLVEDYPRQIIVSDFDKDGHPDIAVVCRSISVQVFRNLGNAEFSEPIDNAVGALPAGLCGADFDRDGYLDIAVGCMRGGVSILKNRGGTSFLCGDVDGNGSVGLADLVTFLNYLYLGAPEPGAIAAADVDCDGRIRPNDVVYLIRYLFRNGPEPCDACLE